jgi:hypothetical protein
LLQNPRDVNDRPVFDDLAASDAVNDDASRLDRFVRRRDTKELPFMNAPTDDVAHNKISFCYLNGDLVTTGSGNAKDFGGLLDASRSRLTPGNGGLCATKSLVSYEPCPAGRESHRWDS